MGLSDQELRAKLKGGHIPPGSTFLSESQYTMVVRGELKMTGELQEHIFDVMESGEFAGAVDRGMSQAKMRLYTKDLEDMLGRMVYEAGVDGPHLYDLVQEAKALLEPTGPTCEIADETCHGEVGQPVGHDLWFCEGHC